MPRILICDDDQAYLGAIQAVLEDFGHEVVTAESASKAQDALTQSAFDIAILDVIMPNGGAIVLLHKIKTNFPSVRTIISTGRSFMYSAPVMEIGLSLADAKIQKSISSEELAVVIKQVMSKDASKFSG